MTVRARASVLSSASALAAAARAREAASLVGRRPRTISQCARLRQRAPRGRKRGIQTDRGLEVGDGGGQGLIARVGRERASGKVRLVGAECGPRRGCGGRADGKPEPQGAGDGPRDLVAHAEDLGRLALVGLRPEVEPLGHAHEVGRDPQPPTGLPHAALEHRAHAEPAPGLLRVERGPLERQRRRLVDDPQSRHRLQSGDQLAGEPVAQVVIGGVGAGVRERQHRDGVGRRRCLGRSGGGRRGVAKPEGHAQEARRRPWRRRPSGARAGAAARAARPW